MIPIELLLKSLFLCFLGLKFVLQIVALTLLLEWTRIAGSKFHKGLVVFLILLFIATIYRSFINSVYMLVIDIHYLVIQTIETIGWSIFVYVLYRSD